MPDTLQESSNAYCALIQRLAHALPGHQALQDFVNDKIQISQSPTKFSLVTITAGSYPGDLPPNVALRDFEGTDELAIELRSLPKPEGCCRLFIVENICGQTVALLGGRFDIDTQFFADHLNNASWYRIGNVADRIPALPSCQKLHDFLQLRYIEARTISNSSNPLFLSPSAGFMPPPEDVESGVFEQSNSWSDAKSFMMPDGTTTRIPRKAGKLIPRERKGETFEPVLCTRQVISVWFSKRETGISGWTGTNNNDPAFNCLQSRANLLN